VKHLVEEKEIGMNAVRGVRLGWTVVLLALVLGFTGWGCDRSEIVTYCDDTLKLYVIDKATAVQSELVDLSSFGLLEPSALTFDTSQKYAVDLFLHAQSTTPSGRSLYKVNISDPLSPTVVPLGDCPKCGGGMAMCKDGQLYSVYGDETTLSELFVIDPVTLNHTLVGGLGFFTGNVGLACEPTTDELYLFSQREDALFIVDKATGHATQVGGQTGLNVPGGIGLEFDPLNALNLYLAANMATGPGPQYQLYTLDPSTGAPTYVGDLPNGERNLGARVVEEEEE
jgi:hypothetical protein